MYTSYSSSPITTIATVVGSSPLATIATPERLGVSPVNKHEHALWTKVRAEVKMIWHIAAPAMLTYIFQYSIAFWTQTLVGHTDTHQLAAFGTQSLILGGISSGIMLGMGSATETLCGQAYGAGKLDMLGIYMQRSWVILSSMGLLLTLVYVFSSYLLKLLGQSAEVASLAGKLSLWLIPQLFAYALNYPMQKFLQAQSKVFVMTCISFVVLVIHVILSWLCIIKFEMGLGGAALTLNISWWLMVLAQLLYIISGRFKQSWTGFSCLAFADLYGFIKISLASGLMLCMEYCAIIVLIILVGFLKNPEVEISAAAICLTVEGWLFMIPLGFTVALSVRVSNELGAGNAKAAKFSVVVMLALSSITQLIASVVVFVSRNDYPAIFTNDKMVMAKVSRISLYVCVSIFFCSTRPIITGVAIGAGWQALMSYVNIGCYYLVGLIFSAVLGFKLKLGLEGLWGGLLIGAAVQIIIALIIIWRADWIKEVKLAEKRLSTWGGEVGDQS